MTAQTAAVANDGTVDFKEIDIYEGIFLEEKFTVDKSTTSFVLKNPNIDTSTARVEVQLNPNEVERTFFSQASNLVELFPSKVYWLEEVDDGYYELSFGDGSFGTELENGAVINVTYLVTNGTLANGIQGTGNYTYIGTTKDSYGTRINDRPDVIAVGVSSGGDSAENVLHQEPCS